MEKYYCQVIEAVLQDKVFRATKYVSPTLIVRATRKKYTYGGKVSLRGGATNAEMILTIGKPNYAEREFIKACKKANEPFPVKKVQLKILKP